MLRNILLLIVGFLIGVFIYTHPGIEKQVTYYLVKFFAGAELVDVKITTDKPPKIYVLEKSIKRRTDGFGYFVLWRRQPDPAQSFFVRTKSSHTTGEWTEILSAEGSQDNKVFTPFTILPGDQVSVPEKK